MQIQISKNKVVSITYQIIDENGDVFEHSDVPMEYIHGIENNMFATVESALEGKKPGDKIEVKLPPDLGFGFTNSELIFTDNIENVPPQYRFVGARPTFQNNNGEIIEMVVSQIQGDKLTVDGNHPLAGQTVVFQITVLGVRDATQGEISDGMPIQPGNFSMHLQ